MKHYERVNPLKSVAFKYLCRPPKWGLTRQNRRVWQTPLIRIPLALPSRSHRHRSHCVPSMVFLSHRRSTSVLSRGVVPPAYREMASFYLLHSWSFSFFFFSFLFFIFFIFHLFHSRYLALFPHKYASVAKLHHSESPSQSIFIVEICFRLRPSSTISPPRSQSIDVKVHLRCGLRDRQHNQTKWHTNML